MKISVQTWACFAAQNTFEDSVGTFDHIVIDIRIAAQKNTEALDILSWQAQR